MLNGKEIDIYIPSRKIGIEYDGFYFHKNYKRDLIKDEICKDNGVSLIRIREKNCAKIDSCSIIYDLEINNKPDFSHIIPGLRFIENYLKVKIDVDIQRDLKEITKLVNFIDKDNCIAITNPEILSEWDYDKNNEFGITPNNISKGSSLKTWWKCNNGHSYKATLSTKINQNTGCPYCSNKTVLSGFNDISTTNPELINEWDFEKNDKLKIYPNKITKGFGKKVWWICPNGHSYDSLVNNRIKGDSCPYCSGHRVMKGFNDITISNPELINEWDFEKNDKLGYYITNYTKGNATKVWWKCPKGHSYQTSINRRTYSKRTNCPICCGHKLLEGFNDVATTNPELLKEWDYDKNNIKPNEITKGTNEKIWWKCPKGHSYQAKIPNRIKGTNCPYCSGNKVLVGFNDLETTHPEILVNWDYEKNEKDGVTPNNISKSYSKKVWWKCEKGHSYAREVYNQRNGYDKCPICKKEKQHK